MHDFKKQVEEALIASRDSDIAERIDDDALLLKSEIAERDLSQQIGVVAAEIREQLIEGFDFSRNRYSQFIGKLLPISPAQTSTERVGRQHKLIGQTTPILIEATPNGSYYHLYEVTITQNKTKRRYRDATVTWDNGDVEIEHKEIFIGEVELSNPLRRFVISTHPSVEIYDPESLKKNLELSSDSPDFEEFLDKKQRVFLSHQREDAKRRAKKARKRLKRLNQAEHVDDFQQFYPSMFEVLVETRTLHWFPDTHKQAEEARIKRLHDARPNEDQLLDVLAVVQYVRENLKPIK